MTCIVGIAKNGIVHIGGDSAAVGGGYFLDVRADQKVFRNGEFLMGFTTSFRMGQLLRYSFKPPAMTEGADLYDYMVTHFVDAVRACLKTGGWASKKEENEIGGTFLVGCRGRLFTIYSDYQVGESVDGMSSVGCGSELALGAMHALTLLEESLTPEARIKIALEITEKKSAGVHGPFLILSIPEPKPAI